MYIKELELTIDELAQVVKDSMKRSRENPPSGQGFIDQIGLDIARAQRAKALWAVRDWLEEEEQNLWDASKKARNSYVPFVRYGAGILRLRKETLESQLEAAGIPRPEVPYSNKDLRSFAEEADAVVADGMENEEPYPQPE